jgi:hypothetical protein
MNNQKERGLSLHSQEWYKGLTLAEKQEIKDKYPQLHKSIMEGIENAKPISSAEEWWASLTKLQKLELRLLFPAIGNTYKSHANHASAYFVTLSMHSNGDMDTKKAWNNMFNLYNVKKQYMTEEKESPFIDTF